MYVIGHLYYLEFTEKLPLHADARTRLFSELPDNNILDCLTLYHTIPTFNDPGQEAF